VQAAGHGGTSGLVLSRVVPRAVDVPRLAARRAASSGGPRRRPRARRAPAPGVATCHVRVRHRGFGARHAPPGRHPSARPARGAPSSGPTPPTPPTPTPPTPTPSGSSRRSTSRSRRGACALRSGPLEGACQAAFRLGAVAQRFALAAADPARARASAEGVLATSNHASGRGAPLAREIEARLRAERVRRPPPPAARARRTPPGHSPGGARRPRPSGRGVSRGATRGSARGRRGREGRRPRARALHGGHALRIASAARGRRFAPRDIELPDAVTCHRCDEGRGGVARPARPSARRCGASRALQPSRASRASRASGKAAGVAEGCGRAAGAPAGPRRRAPCARARPSAPRGRRASRRATSWARCRPTRVARGRAAGHHARPDSAARPRPPCVNSISTSTRQAERRLSPRRPPSCVTPPSPRFPSFFAFPA
jgi:hypothetical protein